MDRRGRTISIAVPVDFVELCEADMTSPEKVICGFIGDLCRITAPDSAQLRAGLVSRSSEDRTLAQAYYDHAYFWQAQWVREHVPHLVKDWEKQSIIGGRQDA